jgi:hypothetical protein
MANSPLEITESIIIPEKIGNDSIQIFLPFEIKWQDQKYYGTFIMTILTEKKQIKNYEIKWSDRTPNFDEFENNTIKDTIKEKLLKKALTQYVKLKNYCKINLT